ncbi:MAG: slipin family protein [Planctomycetota bacterium]|jgi:regulator of protease activity HflC (stomatin/prohibitin superfamily)
MIFNRKYNIRPHEFAFVFKEGHMQSALSAGTHILFDPLRRLKVERINTRQPWLQREDLDVLLRSGNLPDELETIQVDEHERAFVWLDGRLDRVLKPGLYAVWRTFNKVMVSTFDVRNAVCNGPVCSNAELHEVVSKHDLSDEAEILDLDDSQRALVWIDGRFARVLGPGLHVLWTRYQKVKTRIVDATEVKVNSPDVTAIVNSASPLVNPVEVTADEVALWYLDGKLQGELKPGMHAFWYGVGKIFVEKVNLRERMLDLNGQEIITHDKVTLRVNGVITWRVTDPLKRVSVVEDANQSLYRDAQLALRQVVGGRNLDSLLADKEAVADDLLKGVGKKAAAYGIEITALGIRDIILPGDMRELMNKVTEAKKAAEAGLIKRREETAAARMQANTAKILENNPTLMKMRELEMLEKIASSGNLQVILGEQGLKDRIIKML